MNNALIKALIAGLFIKGLLVAHTGDPFDASQR